MTNAHRYLLVVVVVSLAALVAGAATAGASSRCSVGNSGITYNQVDVGAKFRSLQARDGMNCSSARYVLNHWLRRKFARSYGRNLPTSFFDGYVDWSCWKRSSFRWECNEFESGTTFRFTAYVFTEGDY